MRSQGEHCQNLLTGYTNFVMKSTKKIRNIYPHTYSLIAPKARLKKDQKISVGVYLDYASGVSPNPSSIHSEGVKMKKKLEDARAKVANILHARKAEIVFTSGGTESNNLAILGIPKGHIVTTNIEHASVIEACKHRGNATYVRVEPNGVIDPKKIRKALKKNTLLVSVMYANNEIGTVQPIKEIAKEVRHFNKKNKTRIFFHTDAVQAVNYLDLNVEHLGVDMLSLSGSKIEGAGRVGVLYKKTGVPLSPIWGGGDQEFGLRPGTENLGAIIQFGEALEFAQKIKEKENKRVLALRNYFFTQLSRMPLDIRINGDLKERLPNNVNITIPNMPSDLLVIELSARGVMASSKSACKSGDGKASHVIQAINPKLKETDGAIRFSLGRSTTRKDIDYTIKSLSQILTKLKKWYTPTPIE